MKLKVYRYYEGMVSPRYDIFEFEPYTGMTVLTALFHFQEQFDDSLAFRYSCRGAVCGTCAMLINKIPRLACRTQITSLIDDKPKISLSTYPAIEETLPWNPEDEILVEPLPHLPVIKDLIVDTSKFFQDYLFVEPVFKPSDTAPEKERLMEPAAVKELEQYTNCILCATCFGACPINGENPKYLGPAALAKLYCFYIDPRDIKKKFRLKRADISYGWWACEFHGNCRLVCPKNVPPNTAIAKARVELTKMRKQR